MKSVMLAVAVFLGGVAVRAESVCDRAYLWLDASRPDTLTLSDGEVTEWRSVNGGVPAAKYAIAGSAVSPAGPAYVSSGQTCVSFGSTTANRDLGFPKRTDIRSVFMVAKVEQGPHAFWLGDDEAYNFHRGTSGQYWHGAHGYAKNGRTYCNGEPVASPAEATMPARFALFDVQSDVALTASQLCYDRTGTDPRRGGKDIAELLVFTNALSEAEQQSVRGYLMSKWNLFGAGGAEVVRAHPRLTRGLDRESLIGVRLTDGPAGALTNLTVRFDLTNCTPAQVADVRIWRQKYDPVPFAFFERDAVDLGLGGLAGARTEEDHALVVGFAAAQASDGLTVYPKSEGRSEGDYLWITARIDEAIAADAEIWASICGDRVRLSSGDFRLENQQARAPHRPFPFKYHIGAYVRQDRLVGNGSTTSDIFTGNPQERFENLTDVLPIYSAVDGCANGTFSVNGWSAGDTASTRRLLDLRDRYNPGCMIRPSLTPKSWVTANGVNGLAFEVAGAGAATRRQFAASIVSFLQAQRCDGLDVDYEWVRDGTNHREWQNIGRMLRELSEQFFDHGYVLSFAGRSHDSTDSGMPYDTRDYGAFHVADFMMMQTYGGGYLNAAPCIQERGLAVCTKRGLPVRRVVLGQAAYVSADGHPGWDGASSRVAAMTDDPFRRYDIDTWWKTPYGAYWPFEGMSSLQAQCLWARRENLGGVMSWGYYTDPTWTGWNSFGRHQSKAIWPMPGAWPEPERAGGGGDGRVYLLKTESDWFWLAAHANVTARLANDIVFAHDPLVIDCWTGTLDGGGHRLVFPDDVWVVSEKATGLMRTLKGTIRNLAVEMNGRVFTTAARWHDQARPPADVRLVNTTQGENPVGVLAAEAGDGAVIENVNVVLTATSEVKGVKYAGGLVGKVSGGAVITNNAVEVGGRIHVEVRNVWDTAFQPVAPFASATCAKVASADAVVAANAAATVGGGEVETFDGVPEPADVGWGDWYEPTWLRGVSPADVDVRSEAFALEVTFRLPQYASMTFGTSYPQLVRLVGTEASVALSVSTEGGCELFLTGEVWPTYARPVSENVIRANKDVGTGVPLRTDADGRVTILLECRRGELRAYQDGKLLVVTDKNAGGAGYVRSALLGSGVGTLGGGEIVSVRMRLDRPDAAVPPAGFGRMILDEEFEGDAPDASRWEKVPVMASGAPDWRKYTSHRADLTVVTNGCLVLTGAKNDDADPNETRPYLCGQVQSSGKFSFRYGVVELRARFEDQDGAWPAMWMMPQNAVHGGWPNSGEIDIAERLNKDAKVYQTAHFGLNGTDSTSGGTGAIDNGRFNVYRLEWTKHRIAWFVNGVETHAYADPGTGYKSWPFDSPFYLILSQQLEGGWVNREAATDPSTLPVRMHVDYVRVWQQADVAVTNVADWTRADLCAGVTRLEADLTLDASTPRSDLQGVFDGNGHTIYLSGAPLFTKITGVVSNLNLVVVGDIAGTGTLAGEPTADGHAVGVNVTVLPGVKVCDYRAQLPVTLADDLVWLPIGDSITEGEADMGHPERGDADTRGGYRYQLWKALEDSGQKTVSVGYRSGHSGTVEPDDCPWAWHAAQYGGVIMHDNGGTHGAAGFNVETTLEVAGYPDVITVLIGVNDLSFTNGNADPVSWVFGTLKRMVGKLSALRPKSRILVSTLLPAGGGRGYIDTYNALLRAAAEAKSDPFDRPNVTLADLHREAFGGTYVAANYKSDALHPNETGSKALGRAFAAHVQEAVLDRATNVAEIVSVDNARPGVVAVRFTKALGPVSAATLTLTGTNVCGEAVSATFEGGARAPDDARVLCFASATAFAAGAYAARLSGVVGTDGNGLALPETMALDDPSFVEIFGSGAAANVPTDFTRRFVRYGTLSAADGTVNAAGVGSGDDFGANGPGGQFAVDNALPEFARRVGYYVELKRTNRPPQFVWVSMDAAGGFDRRTSRIGIPTAETGNVKALVRNLQVYGNRGNFTNSTLDENGESSDVGIVEFTPWNWTKDDQAGFPQDFNAGGWGWNDTLATGYLKGGMQVAKVLRTADFDNYTKVGADLLFAYNNFNRASPTDLAIGSFSTHRDNAGNAVTVVNDWGDFMAITGLKKFAVNAYEVKKIEIWAEPDGDYVPPNWTHFTTTTSSAPVWTAPGDGVWTKAGSCTVATSPIGFSVGSTASMLTINLVAQLPGGASGALAGWKVGAHAAQLVYRAADGRFDVTYDGTTSHSGTTRSAPADVTAPHVYTIAITAAGTGVMVYQDGQPIVRAPNVYWSNNALNTSYAVGGAADGTQVLAGLTVHSADFNFSAAANAQDRVLSGYDGMPAGTDLATALYLIAHVRNAQGDVVVPTVVANGRPLTAAGAVAAMRMFGTAVSNVTLDVRGIDPTTGRLAVRMSEGLADGSLSVLGCRQLGSPWIRVSTEYQAAAKDGEDVAADVALSADDLSDYRFFRPRAEVGRVALGPVVARTVAGIGPDSGRLARVAAWDGSQVMSVGALSYAGGAADDYVSAYRTVSLLVSGDGCAEGQTWYAVANGATNAAVVSAEGVVTFSGLPNASAGMTVQFFASAVPGATSVRIDGIWSGADDVASEPGFEAPVVDQLADLPSRDFPDRVRYYAAGQQYRIPSMARGGDVAVAAYDMRPYANDLGAGGSAPDSYSPIDIAGNVSTDGGRTWGRPALFVDVPNCYDVATGTKNNALGCASRLSDLGDVCMLYDADVRTFFMMGITGGGLSARKTSDPLDSWDTVIYTRGDGADDAWQPWTHGPSAHPRSVRDRLLAALADYGVSTNFTGAKGILAGPGHGIQTRRANAGRLVVPMQYFGPDGTRVFAAYSDDHGVTWRTTRLVPSGQNSQENCIAEMDDGSWYMIAKKGGGHAQVGRHLYRTADFENWTYLGAFSPSSSVQGSLLKLGNRASDGKGVYAMAFCTSGGAGTDIYQARFRLYLYFGVDGGTSIAWDGASHVALVEGATDSKGYNSMIMVDDATLGVLYEAGGHIFFRRLDVGGRLR